MTFFDPRRHAEDMRLVRRVARYLQANPFTSRRDCELALRGEHSMFVTRHSLHWLEAEGYARRSIESDRYVLTASGEAHIGYARVFHGTEAS